MTIASMSYNTYSTQNTSLAKQMTQNATQSDKTTNTENFVLDKSQAVGKVLGYGVDSEGYFTSDFNEAAGLPKDYKIYAKGLENFTQSYLQKVPFYFELDIAKSIGNAYNTFSSLVDDSNFNQNFKEQDLQKLSQYSNFDYWQSFKDKEATFWRLGDTMVEDLGSQIYTIKDDEISKGGALIAFFGKHPVVSGTTTLLGKLGGLDEKTSESEIKNFSSFMSANALQSSYTSENSEWGLFSNNLSLFGYINRAKAVGDDELTKLIEDLAKEYTELTNADMSLEEFKEKYLDFKERHDDFVKNLELAEEQKSKDLNSNATANSTNSSEATKTENTDDSEEKDKKSFTPIQAESSRETYKDLSGAKNLELAKSQQMADMLAILFNQESSSNSTFKELQKFIGSKTGIDLDSLSNVNSLREFVALKTKKVDIEA